jgi:hypothetical protein
MVHRPDYEMGMERKLNLSRQWSAARTNKVLLHVKLDNGALARLTSPSHLLPCDQHQHSCQFGSVVVIQSSFNYQDNSSPDFSMQRKAN